MPTWGRERCTETSPRPRSQQAVLSISATDKSDSTTPKTSYDSFSIQDQRMDLSGANPNVLPNLKASKPG